MSAIAAIEGGAPPSQDQSLARFPHPILFMIPIGLTLNQELSASLNTESFNELLYDYYRAKFELAGDTPVFRALAVQITDFLQKSGI